MISQKAVVYDGITEEKMTINDKKTMLTPIRKINKNFGTLLCHVDLAKKKIMKKSRIETLRTEMEKGEIKNHSIKTLVCYIKDIKGTRYLSFRETQGN